ncbi:hypothetical protein NC651_024199 [Populus alba x Populus x berolinensis]|nr:hypothetical protein NC651_024199 [Populus alba x Populus x berolinensis]
MAKPIDIAVWAIESLHLGIGNARGTDLMQEQVTEKIRYVGDQLFLISNGGLSSQPGHLRPQAVQTRRPWKFAARLTCGVLKVGSMGEQLLLITIMLSSPSELAQSHCRLSAMGCHPRCLGHVQSQRGSHYSLTPSPWPA